MPASSNSDRALTRLQAENRACRLCAEAGFPIGSNPVLEGRAGQRAYLFGQAPGLVEEGEARPWRGRAGKALRRWLQLDEEAFYATFYCASVTRCYPGKLPSGRGDRAPSRTEQELCARWRARELALLRPALLVPVGGLAIRHLLGPLPVTAAVGTRHARDDGTAVIPLPHPSGASAWLNDPANRARVTHAVELIHAELRRLDPK